MATVDAFPAVARPRGQLGLGTSIAWWAILFWAVVISIVVLVWVTPIILTIGTDLPAPRMNHNAQRRLEMVAHAGAGMIALMIGPWQLLAPLRAARPGLHRWLGRIYVVVAITSGSSSLLLHAKVASFGAGYVLAFMGALWVATTVLGLVTALRRNFDAHRRWMLRSYALAWGAVSIRLFDQLLKYFDVSFADRYPAIVWLALLTNVVLAEIVLRRSKMWS